MFFKKNDSNLIEINDPIVGTESIAHRAFRYAIRAGIITGTVDCPLFFRILSGISLLAEENVATLVRKNMYLFQYLAHIRTCDFEGAISEKRKWASFILNNQNRATESASQIAEQYLRLLESEINGHSKPPCIETDLSLFSGKDSYYVYGPNSTDLPRQELQHATLVLTKFPTFDVSLFPRKIVFLNNYVLQNFDASSLRERTRAYSRVYVPNGCEPFEENVHSMPAIPVDNLASPMGLGRLIFALRQMSEDASFYFEGFDLGLSRTAYSGKIMTAFDLREQGAFERQYCQSLAIHDFVYNFLYLKNALEDARIFGDCSFIDILNMQLQGYLDKLTEARNFSSI